MSDQVPVVSQMGEAILLQERAALFLHGRQRAQDLEDAPFHERISAMISIMNGQLGTPDERRDNFMAAHTKDLLRNTSVKSQLATYLAVQAQIERLSHIVLMIGRADSRLTDPAFIENLTPNQLIYFQRSLHQQLHEISEFVDGQRFEGIESILRTIDPSNQDDEKVKVVNSLKQLPAASREKVQILVTKLLDAVQHMGKQETKQPIIDVSSSSKLDAGTGATS